MDLRIVEKGNGNSQTGANGKANGKSNGATSNYSEFLENLSDDDFGKWKM